jgi:hypothetical protein
VELEPEPVKRDDADMDVSKSRSAKALKAAAKAAVEEAIARDVIAAPRSQLPGFAAGVRIDAAAAALTPVYMVMASATASASASAAAVDAERRALAFANNLLALYMYSCKDVPPTLRVPSLLVAAAAASSANLRARACAEMLHALLASPNDLPTFERVATVCENGRGGDAATFAFMHALGAGASTRSEHVGGFTVAVGAAPREDEFESRHAAAVLVTASKSPTPWQALQTCDACLVTVASSTTASALPSPVDALVSAFHVALHVQQQQCTQWRRKSKDDALARIIADALPRVPLACLDKLTSAVLWAWLLRHVVAQCDTVFTTSACALFELAVRSRDACTNIEPLALWAVLGALIVRTAAAAAKTAPAAPASPSPPLVTDAEDVLSIPPPALIDDLRAAIARGASRHDVAAFVAALDISDQLQRRAALLYTV